MQNRMYFMRFVPPNQTRLCASQFGRPTADSRHLCVWYATALRDLTLAKAACSVHVINLERFTLGVLSGVVYGLELVSSRR